MVRRKNIRLAERYYKFGWDSASRNGAAQVNKVLRGGARWRRMGLDVAFDISDKCHIRIVMFMTANLG